MNYNDKNQMICYCDGVTVADIIDAIDNGASSPKDVVSMTGAMQHCDCENKNPKKT